MRLLDEIEADSLEDQTNAGEKSNHAAFVSPCARWKRSTRH